MIENVARTARMALSTMAAAVAVIVGGGCGVEGSDPVTGDTKGAIPAATPATTPGPASATSADPPKPVASLQLANGNTLEFYGFDSGALISETGPAYTKPAYNPREAAGAEHLTDIWRALAPAEAVPPALAALQARLMNLPAEADVSDKLPSHAEGLEIIPVAPEGEEPVLAAPDGCNNGCCDHDWLSTFAQCQSANADYAWFLFNAGASYANSGSVTMYNGLACSAQGTSTYKVSISSGAGGTWSVPQASYRTYWWLAGTTCNPFCHYADKTVSSTVNTAADMHLHTYCGNFTFR